MRPDGAHHPASKLSETPASLNLDLEGERSLRRIAVGAGITVQ